MTHRVNRTDTQDTLLSGPHAVTRLVELGPSGVLANLGQKTLNRKLDGGEVPADTKVQFLASTLDTKELCYEYDPIDLGGGETTPKPSPREGLGSLVAETSQKRSLPSIAPALTGTSPPIDDFPLSSTDIVQILVARKLKRPIADVPVSKSIKDLCGGTGPLTLLSSPVQCGSPLPQESRPSKTNSSATSTTNSDLSLKDRKTYP